MKKTFIILLYLLSNAVVFAQSNYATCKKASILLKEMEKFHYKPIKLDEVTSSEIFFDVLKSLDPKGFYFSKTELSALEKHKTKIFTQINNGNCDFLNDLLTFYKLKLLYADTVIKFQSKNPFVYTNNESINFNNIESKQLTLADNDTELNKKWYQFLKYQTLKAMFQPSIKYPDILQTDSKTILSTEPFFKEKIKNLNNRKIKRILNCPEGLENFIGKHFLNAIANRFDPHSIYFTPSEKDDFISMISKDGMSFGFYIDENKNGEFEISDLIPGGNAWKTNQLNTGDILVAMKFGNNITVDLAFVDNEEMEDIFDSNSESSTLALTVRKPNGQIKTVSLYKEKTEQEDNIVRSYILNGTKKIGYVSLPSFYDERENKNPLGCGNDVAKEISKLQEEKIEGLILDIRFNGGGSMKEALNLAGIFINEGPLCVVKDKDNKITTLKDMNRGTAYDGPLIVMINGQSASASEMVSATLQDYNRAVIVGNTTFGKGTAQITAPLDANFSLETMTGNEKSDIGYLNITMRKFYRVSTFSHQNKGIKPDILLPDFSLFSSEKESTQKYALAFDTVVKNIYFTALPSLPIDALSSKSTQRIVNNNLFKEVISLNDSMQKIQKETTTVSLNIENYRQLKKRYASFEKSLDSLNASTSKAYTVLNNNLDKTVYKVNDFSKQLNEQTIKSIQNDFYIEEAYHIINDLIEIK